MQRIDAEIMRDSILAVSGGLNQQMCGRPVFPMVPDESASVDELRDLETEGGWA